MMARPNFIFVERAVGEFRNEEFPEAGGSAVRHGMASAIPLVEVSHDTYSHGVRRPDDKMESGDTLHRPEMGAHCFIGFEEGSLGEEMQLKVGEKGGECIGIMPLRDLAHMVGYPKTIGDRCKRTRDDRFEQTGLMESRHGNGLPTSLTEDKDNVVGLRQEASNHNGRGTSLSHRMGTKNREGVPVVTLYDLFELIERQV